MNKHYKCNLTRLNISTQTIVHMQNQHPCYACSRYAHLHGLLHVGEVGLEKRPRVSQVVHINSVDVGLGGVAGEEAGHDLGGPGVRDGCHRYMKVIAFCLCSYLYLNYIVIVFFMLTT